MRFKQWLNEYEEKDFDELLPEPVDVHGQRVNTVGQIDKALARHNYNKGKAWDFMLDPNSRYFVNKLMLVLPKEEQRWDFIKTIEKDPIAQKMAIPLFKQNVTEEEIRDLIERMSHFKILKFKVKTGYTPATVNIKGDTKRPQSTEK